MNMNIEKLDKAIKEFSRKKKENAVYYRDNWNDRKERKAYYQAFTEERILNMTEDEFFEFISKLYSMMIWGNKKYVVDKTLSDNDFDYLKQELAELLYGNDIIENRWDRFIKSIKGIGPATISELLCYIDPTKYMIFNGTTVRCFEYLDVPDMPKYNYQYTGAKYVEVCALSEEISKRIRETGEEDYGFLAVDYFLWDEILPLYEKRSSADEDRDSNKNTGNDQESDSKSIHDEIKEKIVTIGELLGFESRPEVKIATGAIVDAVWEAKIGNMGKAIYVFEVQSKGSIDSLVLNLKKAQANAAVQAVIAVADEKQLSKILEESQGVIDEDTLRTWEAEDVLAVYDSLTRAHESINKLALVPESF